ncbi:MAG: hypothetical protein ACFFDK_18620 [Promethearchaeota archaeon]
MKSITVYFEDLEFDKLKEAKKDTSWHDFILKLVDNKKEVQDNE